MCLLHLQHILIQSGDVSRVQWLCVPGGYCWMVQDLEMKQGVKRNAVKHCNTGTKPERTRGKQSESGHLVIAAPPWASSPQTSPDLTGQKY